jgi:hypothetical protein
MFEQFAGIAYIAVVVSRLIGMTIGHKREERSEEQKGRGHGKRFYKGRQIPERD